MRRILPWLILLVVLLAVLVVYLIPVPRASSNEVYAKVDAQTVASLQDFREQNPPRSIDVDGATWEYVSLGAGEQTILFLHGMTGAHDIWWQQAEAYTARLQEFLED